MQNMKAKIQRAMDSGSGAQAWRITGLPDYLKAKKFVRDVTDLAVIVGFEKQRLEISKPQAEFKEALEATMHHV